MHPRDQILIALFEAGSDPTRPDPSLDELGALIGVNRQTAYYHLQRLRTGGLVYWDGDTKRALTEAGAKEAKRLLRARR